MLSALAIKPPPGKKNKKSSWLKSLDMLGQSFSLRFDSSTGKFQTGIGGCVTLILVFITVFVFIAVMSQYFDKSSPVVTTSKEYFSEIKKINLYKEDLYIPIVVQFANRFAFKDVFRFLTLKASIRKLSFNHTTEVFDVEIEQQVDYVFCSELEDPKVDEVIKLTTDLELFQRVALCPDFRTLTTEIEIYGTMADFSYKRISIDVYPCSLEDPSQCASPQELKYITVYFAKALKLMISSNYQNPIKRVFQETPVTVDKSRRKYMRFKIFSNQVLDITEYFKKPSLRKEYGAYEIDTTDSQERNSSMMHCTEKLVKLGWFGPCEPYVTFEMRAKPQIVYVTRNYKKLSTILGEFGGILKLITTVALTLFAFFNSKSIRSFILKDLKPFKGKLRWIRKVKKTAESPSPQRPNQEERLHEQEECLNNHLNSPHSSPNQQIFTRIDQKEIEEEFELFFKRKLSVNDFITKLNFVEFLQQILLDGEEESLIPLALISMKLRARKSKVLRRGSKPNRKNLQKTIGNQGSTIKFAKIDKLAQKAASKRFLKGNSPLKKTNKNSLKENFESLKKAFERSKEQETSWKKSESLKSLIKSSIFDSLADVFENPEREAERQLANPSHQERHHSEIPLPLKEQEVLVNDKTENNLFSPSKPPQSEFSGVVEHTCSQDQKASSLNVSSSSHSRLYMKKPLVLKKKRIGSSAFKKFAERIKVDIDLKEGVPRNEYKADDQQSS